MDGLGSGLSEPVQLYGPNHCSYAGPVEVKIPSILMQMTVKFASRPFIFRFLLSVKTLYSRSLFLDQEATQEYPMSYSDVHGVNISLDINT